MSNKSTSISQEEIRFLLKDFPCGSLENEPSALYEAPFINPHIPGKADLKRESLTRQIRRLFALSLNDKL